MFETRKSRRIGIRWHKGVIVHFGGCDKGTVVMFFKSPYHLRMHIQSMFGWNVMNLVFAWKYSKEKKSLGERESTRLAKCCVVGTKGWVKGAWGSLHHSFL